MQRLPCKNRETCVGRTIWPIVCADTFVDQNSYTFDRWSCTRRSIAKSSKNELKGCHNEIVWLSFVRMQDSWQRLTSHSASWQKTLKNSHNLQSQWLVVSTLCQEMKNYLTRKVGSEGTPKLGPYLKLQLVAYKVNMEWKLEFSLQTKTILTRGSEFLMAWISW